MTSLQAKQLILKLKSGSQLDSLVDTIIFDGDCQPIYFWDSMEPGNNVGRFYPFVPERFKFMKILHKGDVLEPIHIPPYSNTLDLAEIVMEECNIHLYPVRGTTLWKARSGEHKVVNSSSAVAVCQLALIKKLRL